MKRSQSITILSTIGAACIATPALSSDIAYSVNTHGTLGLNTIPSGRMDKTGTVRTGLSHLDPYLHGFIGLQLADPLYIGIRQSAETSSFSEDFDRLYPGIDAKLRLTKESAHIPQVVFGVQSSFGHTRQSGEYLALSKRYKNFDFTGGIGWGRFASAAHIDNPLNAISNHFGKRRELDSEDPTTPDNWFTGEDIGFFAGLEYFTPLKELSLKADFGGDRYEAEKAAFNFKPAAPWSLGLNYKPWEFMDIGIASQGLDKIIARLSFQENIKNWRHRSTHHKISKSLSPARTESTLPGKMQTDSQKDHIALSNISTDQTTAEATLQYSPHHASPRQFIHAATHIANNAGPFIEEIKLHPRSKGLRGPTIQLARGSLESALAHNNGSSDEIWHTTEFTHNFKGIQKLRPHPDKTFGFKNFSFTLDNQFSLSEEDTSLLRRTSFIASMAAPEKIPYLSGGLGLRLNLSDNLGKLRRTRPRSSFPIKSDVYDFADRKIAIDHAYTALTHTIAPNTHGSFMAGYLDENFTGIGSELLYRPFDKRYAIGAESWLVRKRDPFTTLNLGTRQSSLFAAHINGWYDIPKADITLGVKAGRFLARDIGATASLTKNFKNGATIEGYISISDKADFDLFGGTTHADHGLRLSLPLGGYKYTPNAQTRVTAAPFGRDIAQTVTNPISLYDANTPFSLARISKHWDELND